MGRKKQGSDPAERNDERPASVEGSIQNKGAAQKERSVLPKIGVGHRVGALTVSEPTDKRKSRYMVWRCVCDCGGEIHVDTRTLQRKTVDHCGCQKKANAGTVDLTGSRFGFLVALEQTDKRRKCGSVIWRCRCELCGEEAYVSAKDLTSGNTKSCGKHPRGHVDIGILEGTSIRKLEYYMQRLFPRNTSGHTGVRQDKRTGKWIAEMTFQGKKILYEKHRDKAKAIAARKRAEAQIHEFLEDFYERHPEWNRDFYSETV